MKSWDEVFRVVVSVTQCVHRVYGRGGKAVAGWGRVSVEPRNREQVATFRIETKSRTELIRNRDPMRLRSGWILVLDWFQLCVSGGYRQGSSV